MKLTHIAMPMRVTDNAKCNVTNPQPYCNGSAISADHADVLNPLDYGMVDMCADTVQIPTGQSGSLADICVTEYGLPLGDENTQMADFSALCRELGEKEHIVAIAWTLAHPAVDSAIVGIRTLAHLDGIERAAEMELSAEVMARLDEIFDVNRGRPLRTGKPAPEAYAW